MIDHERLHAGAPKPPFSFRIRLLLLAVSFFVLVAINVALFRYSQLIEFAFRRSLTEIRPWIWPEGAAAFFMLVWFIALIACGRAGYRISGRPLKYTGLFFAAGALIALVVNAWFGMREAFKF